MPDISSILSYVDKLYRQTRVATLDAMDRLNTLDDRKWGIRPDESWRWLDKLSNDWNEQSLNLVPWTVMTWRLPSPYDLELSIIHRYMSRVYRFEPMIVVALADLTPTPADSAGFWLEDQIRRRTVQITPVLGQDDRLVDVVSTSARTRPKHVAFAVSLARLTDPEHLDHVLVQPLACLVKRDHAAVLDVLSPEDPARVALNQ